MVTQDIVQGNESPFVPPGRALHHPAPAPARPSARPHRKGQAGGHSEPELQTLRSPLQVPPAPQGKAARAAMTRNPFPGTAPHSRCCHLQLPPPALLHPCPATPAHPNPCPGLTPGSAGPGSPGLLFPHPGTGLGVSNIYPSPKEQAGNGSGFRARQLTLRCFVCARPRAKPMNK